MMELFQESIRLVNLPFTMLAGLAVLYWVLVIFGMVDLDALDFDLDLDLDVDAAADLDADAHGLAGTPLASVLSFLGLHDAPLMLAMSFYFFSMWAISVLANYYLNPGHVALVSVVIIVVNIFVSLFVMKITTRPFAKLYRILNTDYDAPQKVIGSICTVTSLEISDRVGSCEITAKGAPIQLNAVNRGTTILKKGDEALVVKYDKEKRVYEIEPINLED
jgi:hypothetical protein